MARRGAYQRESPMDALASSLSSGELLSVYVVTGVEAFLRQRARRMIRERVVDREGGSVHVFGPDDSLEAVLTELRGDSLFASRRMVEIIQADAFVRTHGEAFVRYLERPSAAATLVIDAEKVDKRTKFPSVASSKGMLIDFAKVYEDQLPRWVMTEAKSRNVAMGAAAAAALVEEVGDNLFGLSSELDKLVTYVGDRRRIDPHDVAEIVGRSRSWEVWGLTDALGRRDVAPALTILERLLIEGTSAIQIVGSLNWQLRRLWEARRLLDGGAGEREMMSALRISPRFVGALCDQARRFSEKDLARIMRMLLEVDIRLKSTSLPEKLLVERFLVEACAQGGSARSVSGHS